MDNNLQDPGDWQLPHRLAGHRHMRHALGQGLSGKAGKCCKWCQGEGGSPNAWITRYIAIDILVRTTGAAPVVEAAAETRSTFAGEQRVLMLGLTRDVGEDPFEPRARAIESTAVAGRVSPPAARLSTPKPHQTAMRGVGACTLRAFPRSLPLV